MDQFKQGLWIFWSVHEKNRIERQTDYHIHAFKRLCKQLKIAVQSRWLAGADTESSQFICITEFNYCFLIETDLFPKKVPL